MSSRIYAVLGKTLAHSLSPFIHRQILEHLGVDGLYGILEVGQERVPQIIDTLKSLNYSGVNVTIPYKEILLPYLDELSPEARLIGAINTVAFTGSRAVGYNTDYFGFRAMLEQADIPVAGRDAVVCGAGGASLAVISALHSAQARTIRVLARSLEQLSALSARFPELETYPLAAREQLHGDILINTTPVGMYPQSNATIATEEEIARFAAVVDCVYNPLTTKLVQDAQKLGIPACTGLWMLVHQALKAQEIWQGQPISAAVAQPIYDSLRQALASSQPSL